jgi:hypothetical protein
MFNVSFSVDGYNMKHENFKNKKDVLGVNDTDKKIITFAKKL